MLGKTAVQKKEKMPVNCHLKFRIIPPETACNDHVAARHKAELLKLVWDEQWKTDCCNGFNVIPPKSDGGISTLVQHVRHRAAALSAIIHSRCQSLSTSISKTAGS